MNPARRRIEYSSSSEDGEEGGEGDLSTSYQPDYASKFSKRITSFSIAKKSKMSSILKTYD